MNGKSVIQCIYDFSQGLIALFVLTLLLTIIFPLPHPVLAAEATTATSNIQFQIPHQGVITTYFSWVHPGIDLAAPFGTPIHPIAPGTVIKAGWDNTGYGNMVEIDHGNGYKSLYAHMDKIMVKVGQSVTDSDEIGDIGITGNTTGPHTHLEISKDGTRINPLTVLPPITNLANANKAQETGTGGPTVVATVPSSLSHLPQTGVPLAGVSLAGLVPLGKRFKKYGKSKKLDEDGLSTWKKRELQRVGFA